jgi:hypothetical protein
VDSKNSFSFVFAPLRGMNVRAKIAARKKIFGKPLNNYKGNFQMVDILKKRQILITIEWRSAVSG